MIPEMQPPRVPWTTPPKNLTDLKNRVQIVIDNGFAYDLTGMPNTDGAHGDFLEVLLGVKGGNHSLPDSHLGVEFKAAKSLSTPMTLFHKTPLGGADTLRKILDDYGTPRRKDGIPSVYGGSKSRTPKTKESTITFWFILQGNRFVCYPREVPTKTVAYWDRNILLAKLAQKLNTTLLFECIQRKKKVIYTSATLLENPRIGDEDIFGELIYLEYELHYEYEKARNEKTGLYPLSDPGPKFRLAKPNIPDVWTDVTHIAGDVLSFADDTCGTSILNVSRTTPLFIPSESTAPLLHSEPSTIIIHQEPRITIQSIFGTPVPVPPALEPKSLNPPVHRSTVLDLFGAPMIL